MYMRGFVTIRHVPPDADPTPKIDLLPAIDLRGGRVVRLLRGDYDQQTTYGDDPAAQAQAFAEAGSEWVHIVDLDAARTGKMSQLPHIQRVCEQTDLRVQVGGGVRSENAIDALFRVGVQRVVLGSAALRNMDWFESLMGNPTYRGRLVLGLDAKDGKVAVDGWEQTTGMLAEDVARRVTDWPLAGIVYTDIARDGTLEGPSLESTRQLAEATDVRVIASGGVGTLDDIRALRDLPIAGVIVGKALYEGRFTVEQALAELGGSGGTGDG
jgi:phosphoribosylformimino-5-aminoimidazole carboxamide ribotide isomerase